MTACCGASTPVDELRAALAGHGQTVALPAGGTVGGALSAGQSDHRRLGWGPVRDTLLQARYVSAAGDVVRAGGPTVKNVSGFDLCRLLVGARGALGFLGEVILRTRPLPESEQWFTAAPVAPDGLAAFFTALYRPTCVLWDGARSWVLLGGHPGDIAAQARRLRLEPCDGPPVLPTGSRRSLPPSAIPGLQGRFIAEVGVGVVHHAEPWAHPPRDARATALALEVKRQFDPTGRLNPGVPV
jgi:glycolate oxidase FAD binding subunit